MKTKKSFERTDVDGVFDVTIEISLEDHELIKKSKDSILFSLQKLRGSREVSISEVVDVFSFHGSDSDIVIALEVKATNEKCIPVYCDYLCSRIKDRFVSSKQSSLF